MNEKGERLRTGKKLSRSRPVSPTSAGSWALEFINLFEKKVRVTLYLVVSHSVTVSHSVRPDVPVLVQSGAWRSL